MIETLLFYLSVIGTATVGTIAMTRDYLRKNYDFFRNPSVEKIEKNMYKITFLADFGSYVSTIVRINNSKERIFFANDIINEISRVVPVLELNQKYLEIQELPIEVSGMNGEQVFVAKKFNNPKLIYIDSTWRMVEEEEDTDVSI